MSATETKKEERVRTMPMYKVLLHNDDVNTMDHVVRSVMHIFRLDVKKAASIMIEAHETGVALCAVEPLEIAELHKDQLAASSLSASIEPDS